MYERTGAPVEACAEKLCDWHYYRQLKPKVQIQTLESLAYTLNHIFLEDRKIKTYELSDTDSTLVAAEPEVTYGRNKQQ